MSETHAEKIREAVTDLGLAKPNEIMNWIKEHYPGDNVNVSSYRADIIGCSINHSSQHHYPGMPKFLWFEESTKKYRLASLEEAARPESIEDERELLHDPLQGLVDGVPIAKMSVTGQIAIPAAVREKLDLKPGDLLAFIMKDNVLEVRRAKIKIEVE